MPIPVRPDLPSRQPKPQPRIGLSVPGALALALALLATPALADPRMAGRFVGHGEGQLELKVIERTAGATASAAGGYRVEASTGVRNTCSGTLSGLAKAVSPRTLLLREPAGEEDTCELTLRFSPDYARVEMSAQSCSSFHGTACAFVGTLRRR